MEEGACSPTRSVNDKLFEFLVAERDALMKGIREELGVISSTEVNVRNLSKRHVTKEKLCSWVERMSSILNSNAIPLLQITVPKANKCELLEQGKIKDQLTIIKLQDEVLKKKDEEVEVMKQAMKQAVKSEITSYASAVTKSCASALAPRKISEAVKTVVDRDERKRNVVIYGVPEQPEEKLPEKVESILQEIGEKPVVKDCCRIGVKKPDAVRPIKFTLGSTDIVSQVLRKSHLLRSKDGFRTVYLSPDRTKEERTAYKLSREKKKTDKAQYQHPSETEEGVLLLMNKKST